MSDATSAVAGDAEGAAAPAPTAADLARHRAGRALRDLGHAMVGRDVPTELVEELADSLERDVARFSTGERRSREAQPFRGTDRPEIADGERIHSYDDRPFSGRASPWGLDLQVHRRGDEIEGLVTLRSAHEGAPGRSHGGIVAGLFDDVFGFVLDIVNQAAFTGELTVRYVAPTPLHRPLACRGRLRERVGRKLFIEGELVDLSVPGEPVVARGDGLFIAVDPDVVRSARLPVPRDGIGF